MYSDNLEIKEKSDNLEIKETLDNLPKDKKGGIVVFYAPWCGHCEKMKKLNKFLGENINKTYNVFYKTVNCDDENNKEIVENEGIIGFPTIKFRMGNGNFQEYNEERTIENIISQLSEISNS